MANAFFKISKVPSLDSRALSFCRQVAKIQKKKKNQTFVCMSVCSPPTSSLPEGCTKMVIMGNNFFFFFVLGTQHQSWRTSCWRRPQVRPNGRGLAGISPARHWVWTQDLLSPRVLEGAIEVRQHPRAHADNFASLTRPTDFLRWKRGFFKDVIMTQNYQVNKTKIRSKASIK
jgi:hypothetical protein